MYYTIIMPKYMIYIFSIHCGRILLLTYPQMYSVLLVYFSVFRTTYSRSSKKITEKKTHHTL